MHELKKSIGDDKIFFGVKETIKNSGNLMKAIITSDCREHIKNLLKANKIDIRVINFSKEELVNKLGLKFKCEVFGVRK